MTRRESIKIGGGTLLAILVGVKLVESDDEKFERNVRNGPVRNATFTLRKQHVFETPVYIENCTFVAGRQKHFLADNNATITVLGKQNYFCNNTIKLSATARFI